MFSPQDPVAGDEDLALEVALPELSSPRRAALTAFGGNAMYSSTTGSANVVIRGGIAVQSAIP